ncbi:MULTISPECIES: DUF4355 domain-containing protein [unclassified Facklamia]|uniref:DUF4355 domain-containing protein n=1 Tax=Aerococcaceae TaxID=186827 RepID=UPI0013BD30C4|nr:MULTISPECIES: DUF4355 domain-containing protein [unclassified Facklamia]MBS4462825.1 DUF4355 domain-containing protein [Aerococcaceae bacterium zg-B36]NEW65274.1 DUF4355 domain-containing protein [Facklamia sp. 252]NEW68746.1 DUF4355 domain-containing protein [Facklamia sp. 253]QQD66134.1 DUF4355 domain-containing protein [Aerococcaceae bacterium zg-252]
MSIENKPLKLNLQLFAEEGASVEGENAENTFNPIMSQSELDSVINKVVQTALGNQASKFEAEKEKAIQEALAKEKDYAKLSEEDREKRQFEDERTQFEKERAEFMQKQRVVELEKDLMTKKLPVELAEMFALYPDNTKALAAVNAFEKTFNEAVSKAVREAIRQNDPIVGGGTSKEMNYGAKLAGNQQNKQLF